MSVPHVLNGRYEIKELLGRGGMADVYLAKDTLLGRSVAIKLLRADVARETQLQARFRREAQAVAGLNHPSIVGVYDTGEHVSDDPLRDGATLPYIVMEYVKGKTLRDLVRSKSLTIDQSIEFSLGVLSALEYSHRAGIIHRDIKPANVMVTQDDDGNFHDVKVMDFGIARTISDAAATMTQTQTVMGTAQYLSPEQARGENVDARSDLYSAACLLYEMITGRPPFMGDSPVSVAYQHVREEPPVPSNFNAEVTPALESVLMHALLKDRVDRFQDAASFRRALFAARSGVVLNQAPRRVVPEAVAPTSLPEEPHVDRPVALVAASSVQKGPIDQEPSTRAMAKVLAGGPLVTDAPVVEPSEPQKAVKRRRRAWTVTLFVFLALILGTGGFFVYNLANSKPAAPVQISVPAVAGKSEVDAMTDISALGLIPKHADAFSETVAAGLVIGTDPQAAVMVNPQSVVTVILSKGPSSIKIPTDIAGKSEYEVKTTLQGLGVTFTDNDQVDNGTIPANMVVTTDPAPGTDVPVGTPVTLKISTGNITMPSLFDLSKDPNAVQKAVSDLLTKTSPLLSVDFVYAENSVVTPGMVIKQSEAQGTHVPQRTRITVTLAKAPPKPEPSSTPSPAPTSDPSALADPSDESDPQ